MPDGFSSGSNSVAHIFCLKFRHRFRFQWWEQTTGDRWKALRNLKNHWESFERNRQEKNEMFWWKKPKRILESLAGFPVSLIWSYFPLAPLCLQMYVGRRNLYVILFAEWIWNLTWKTNAGMKFYWYLHFRDFREYQKTD